MNFDAPNAGGTPPISRQAQTLLHELNVVRMRLRFLPAAHPSIQQVFGELHRTIAETLRSDQGLVLVLKDLEFYVNGVRLPRESLQYRALAEGLADAGVKSLRFVRGISQPEVVVLVDACFGALKTPQPRPRVVAQAADHTPRILLNEDRVQEDGTRAEASDEPRHLSAARDTYQACIQAIIATQIDTQHGGQLNLSLVEGLVGTLQQGLRARPDLYQAMTHLRDLNEYTFFHSVNVALLSMLLGTHVGLSSEQVSRLGVAAMLHDVGKSRVPEEILNKPGQLTDAERKQMEAHPLTSVRILLEQTNLCPASIAVAAQHHVHFDLSGYPHFGGYGKLHLFSHIVTIADVYDALCSERSYKPAMLPDRAMTIMLEGMGTMFHPVLMKAFFRLVGPYPAGTVVELDTGELAIVTTRNSRDPFRPRITLLAPFGAQPDTGRNIDLAKEAEAGYHPRSILQAIDPRAYGIAPTTRVSAVA